MSRLRSWSELSKLERQIRRNDALSHPGLYKKSDLGLPDLRKFNQGAPKKPLHKLKCHAVQAYLNKKQWNKFESLANEAQMSMGNFVRFIVEEIL